MRLSDETMVELAARLDWHPVSEMVPTDPNSISINAIGADTTDGFGCSITSESWEPWVWPLSVLSPKGSQGIR